jgi:hypothetical protein
METLDLRQGASNPVVSRPNPLALLKASPRPGVASGWDTANTPDPRASHDDAVGTVANSPSPRDVTADDIDNAEDLETDDAGDTDSAVSEDDAGSPADRTPFAGPLSMRDPRW